MPHPVLTVIAQWRGVMEDTTNSSMDIVIRQGGTSERLVGPHRIH